MTSRNIWPWSGLLVVIMLFYYCHHKIFDPLPKWPWRHLWTTLEKLFNLISNSTTREFDKNIYFRYFSHFFLWRQMSKTIATKKNWRCLRLQYISNDFFPPKVCWGRRTAPRRCTGASDARPMSGKGCSAQRQQWQQGNGKIILLEPKSCWIRVAGI